MAENNRQLNKAVAETLGLDIIKTGINAGLVYWRGQNHEEFKPATKPAEALWAMERYCDENGCVAHLIRSAITKEWTCCFHGESPHKAYKTQQEAICRAIVGYQENNE